MIHAKCMQQKDNKTTAGSHGHSKVLPNNSNMILILTYPQTNFKHKVLKTKSYCLLYV